MVRASECETVKVVELLGTKVAPVVRKEILG